MAVMRARDKIMLIGGTRRSVIVCVEELCRNGRENVLESDDYRLL
jgi:hypothetical protein